MNWRRSLIAVAATAPLVALLGWGMTRNPNEVISPLPGRPAPGFSLAIFASGADASEPRKADSVRLASHAGEVVVLNFWASWCLACRDEHQALAKVGADYSGKDVKFFGLLYNDSPANGRAWIREMGGQSYPSVLDPGSRTAIDYGLYGVPETVFIGKDGRVAYKHIGPVTEALLVQKIESLRAVPMPNASAP